MFILLWQVSILIWFMRFYIMSGYRPQHHRTMDVFLIWLRRVSLPRFAHTPVFRLIRYFLWIRLQLMVKFCCLICSPASKIFVILFLICVLFSIFRSDDDTTQSSISIPSIDLLRIYRDHLSSSSISSDVVFDHASAVDSNDADESSLSYDGIQWLLCSAPASTFHLILYIFRFFFFFRWRCYRWFGSTSCWNARLYAFTLIYGWARIWYPL